MSTLADKLLAFDPNLPLEHAHTIPSTWYTDPEILERERSSVFGNSWLMVGRVDQVREPGSFFTFEVAGEPLVVARDQNGTLRAFVNVCRHRAARVVEAACGKATKFRCRYHGWTYDLAGRLRGTPEFDGVCDFQREQNGLAQWSVETWGPFVFVHAGSNPPSLAAHLSPMPDRIADFHLESLRFVERREYELKCNWKVYVDNFLDGGYHVNTVHPALSDALDYAHYRAETFDHSSVQISPLQASPDATMASVRTGSAAHYWWIYPNFMVNLYQGVMDTNLVLPLGTDRCLVLFDFYFQSEARDFQANSIRVAERIQQEDIDICEEVQRGLRSRSFHTGRFSVRRENAGYHFHRLLAMQLAKDVSACP